MSNQRRMIVFLGHILVLCVLVTIRPTHLLSQSDSQKVEVDTTHVDSTNVDSTNVDSDDDEEDAYIERTVVFGHLDDSLAMTKRYDSATVQQRQIDDEQWKSITSDDDYSYDRGRHASDLTWLGRIIDRIFRFFIPKNFPSLGISFWKIVSYTLIVIFLVLVLVWFSKAGFKGTLYGAPKAMDQGGEAGVEDINSINFEEMLQQALAAKDYRRAVRVLFLKELHALNTEQRIVWDPAKTNRRYIEEIQDTELRALFKRICWLFDLVWYGEYQLDAELYAEVEKDFAACAKLRLSLEPIPTPVNDILHIGREVKV